MSRLILIMGSGGIGRRHAQAAKNFWPDARLVAVRDGESEATLALGMQVVPTLEAALALGPDAAIVALPPRLHGPVGAAILEAGVPLYLEKPVAIDSDQIASAAQRAQAQGVVTQVGCVLRFLPGFAKIASWLAQGLVGEVRHARLAVGQWLPDWRPGRDWRQTYSAHRAEGGGVLLDLIHETDMARFLFGEFDHVSARVVRTGALDADVEDSADLLYGRDGLSVSVHLDYLDRAGCRQGRIVGALGSIEYDLRAGRLALWRDGGWHDMFEAGDFDVAAAHVTAITHFLDHVGQGLACRQPIIDGVRSLQLVERARAAAGAP